MFFVAEIGAFVYLCVFCYNYIAAILNSIDDVSEEV